MNNTNNYQNYNNQMGGTPVGPTPMPASGQSVNPTPMPAAPQGVSPTPMAAPQQPQEPQPVQPTPAPAPAPVQTVAPQQEIPSASTEDVAVINTVKKRTSNVILVLILILLVVFVIKIDDVIVWYDNYMASRNGVVIDDGGEENNNLNDGYIIIGENTGFIKLSEIKFYNFKKGEDSTISLSYEAFAKYDASEPLKIYIELYNTDKELLYKELFSTEGKIEKDAVRMYPMVVDAEVYQSSYYAIVKQYTEDEEKSQTQLTCTKEDSKYSYKNIYTFNNGALSSYTVETTALDETDTSLEDSLKLMNKNLNPSYENHTLKYSVDLSLDLGDYNKLYGKGLSSKIIKDRETLKEWKCE